LTRSEAARFAVLGAETAPGPAASDAGDHREAEAVRLYERKGNTVSQMRV
jgi:hypothetical protein